VTSEFIERELPIVEDHAADDQQALRDEHDEVRRQRKLMVNDFMKPGNPGLKLKGEFDRMIRNLVAAAYPELAQSRRRPVQSNGQRRDQVCTFE